MKAVRTALYRFYDADDDLLYVGITENLSVRFASHKATKPWWPDVVRHSVEWRETRAEAEDAEKAAMIAERPKWNVANSPWAPEPYVEPWIREALETGDALPIAEVRANFTEVIQRVRILRKHVFLMRRNKPQAALVPIELGDLVVEAGGADAAIALLSKALRSEP